MVYYGDFPTGATVRMPFQTFDSAGASITITGFAAADIEIYKNGGTTQRSSDVGYTATTDFDALTGLHMVVIDTNDNSDPGFFAAGNEYFVAVSAITADTQTVSFWAGSFSIERSGGMLALLKDATFGLSAIETLVDGVESALTSIESKVDIIDTTADAILVDTGTTLDAAIAVIDANVDAILLDTGTTGVIVATNNDKTGYAIGVGGIASTAFAAGAITAAALAQDAAREVADEVLDRDIAGGASGGSRNVRNALRALRNRQNIATGTLTVYQEDDTTSAWTAAITTAAGDPITQIDPA